MVVNSYSLQTPHHQWSERQTHDGDGHYQLIVLRIPRGRVEVLKRVGTSVVGYTLKRKHSIEYIRNIFWIL